MDNLRQLIEKWVRQERASFLFIEAEVVYLSLYKSIFGGIRRMRVDCDRAHHPRVCIEGGSGSGVRRCGGLGTCGIED